MRSIIFLHSFPFFAVPAEAGGDVPDGGHYDEIVEELIPRGLDLHLADLRLVRPGLPYFRILPEA